MSMYVQIGILGLQAGEEVKDKDKAFMASTSSLT